MGDYEPRDSRIVTQNPSATPGEPDRTGPREGETREESSATGPAERNQSEDRKPAEAEQPIDEETAERWQVTKEDCRWGSGADAGEDD
jgi:hypothetical protein